MTLAIVGRPNVGKSSLFNRLLEQDRAIVTDIPGTTRDLVSETAAIDGIPVKLCDTAGIRADRRSCVETLGIERSYQAMADADLTLVVVDLSRRSTAEDERLIARAGRARRWWSATSAICRAGRGTGRRCVPVSALTGEGIAELREAILEAVAPKGVSSRRRGFITSLRHEQLLRESVAYLEKARDAVRASHPARDAAARSLRRAAADRRHHRRHHRRRHPESNLLHLLHRQVGQASWPVLPRQQKGADRRRKAIVRPTPTSSAQLPA